MASPNPATALEVTIPLESQGQSWQNRPRNDKKSTKIDPKLHPY